MLFIGYSGYPVSRLYTCTEAACLSRSAVRAYVQYIFPTWLLKKIVSVTLMASSQAEIQISLTVRRIIPAGAEIHRLCQLQDVNGLRRLLNDRLASPNDSLARSGQSLLQVRETMQ